MNDHDFSFLSGVSAFPDFQREIAGLQANWGDTRLAYFADRMMQEYGLECMQGPDHRSCLLFKHNTRRKRPAFLYVHREPRTRYEWSVQRKSLGFTIEVVHAGKHAVAGASEDTGPWSEAEG